MSDDEQEMARLRQSKKHQQFEKKYSRDSARMIREQLQAQQLNSNVSPSPSPPPKATKTTNIADIAPHIITEQQIKKLPTSFGKQTPLKRTRQSNSNTKADFSQEFKSDNQQKHFEKTTKKYFERVVSDYKIPLTYVAKLKGHSSLVSTMSLDRSGTRLLTGSYDSTVKFWDFGGMNEKLEHFRSITPFDGYVIKQLQYNYSGSQFLCITSFNKPLIYDRDGRLLYDSYKSGDMYIRDMNHTFGHTMPLNGGMFFGMNSHRQNMNEFATYSQDSTFRIWDIEADNGKCKQIIKARNRKGKRISITCADTSTVESLNKSFMIVCGCNDGSLQIFDFKSHCKRPKKIVDKAHECGTDMSGIMIDGNHILSRGGMNDNTLKVWDIRQLRDGTPLKVFENMFNIASLSNIIKTPNGNAYITCVSNKKDLKTGKSCLSVIDRDKLTEMIRIPISDKAVNCVVWHPKINQLFIGGNDSNVRVFYESEGVSKNGVLLCAKRKYKKKHIDQQIKYQKIINPNGLRVYKKQSEILADKRKKDLKLHKPEMPHYGIGVQGRINTESFSHSVYKSQSKNVMSQVDPRDRLLLFQEKAEQDQKFTAIYNINQPNPVFQEKDTLELEASEIVSKLYKEKPGARQYNTISDGSEPPKKKQKQ